MAHVCDVIVEIAEIDIPVAGVVIIQSYELQA